MWLLLAVSCLFFAGSNGGHFTAGFRPPAVPLIVSNPYNSFWSVNTNLSDGNPQHWSGSNLGSVGMIKIDNVPYRFYGAHEQGAVADTFPQCNVSVYPTQTVYIFQKSGIQLKLTFSTPALMDDEEFIGLPVTFITHELKTIDGKEHKVELYYDNTAEGVVSYTNETVTWESNKDVINDVETLEEVDIGFAYQEFDVDGTDRVNWGHWYLATDNGPDVKASVGYSYDTRNQFVMGAAAPPPRPMPVNNLAPCADGNSTPVLFVHWSMNVVKPNITVVKKLRIFAESNFSIDYFGTNMEPLWKYKYGSVKKALNAMSYEDIISKCNVMDTKVIQALNAVGGANYSTLGSLAWRQAVGGLAAVWNDKMNTSWIFLKEISSDGDVSTVDVIFPASPLYLWASPGALKKMLIPLLEYANNNTAMYGNYTPYNLPWAPHHLGKWPVCNLKPSDQEQMPVEESGNMLMMIAGIVKYQRNDTSVLNWLKPYWGLLRTWAGYIIASLPNPGDQLCTDDFEGRSPNNTNLAVKGIVGLSSYIYLLEVQEKIEKIKNEDISALRYLNKDFMLYFLTKGLANSSDHYTRQFGLPNSWSLKYNLLFQKILGTNDFSDDFIHKELDFYKTKMNAYGIPLDDRHPYTKTDWLMWIAALADETMFQSIADSVYKFANETPDRVPFTDWYDVTNGKRAGGFRARPVIGGIFARLLTNPPQE